VSDFTTDIDEEDFGVVRWWDDLELTGREKKDEKELAAWAARLSQLYDYCKTDVEAERSATDQLYPLSPDEQEVYYFDQIVNDRGVAVDIETTRQAIALIDRSSNEINKRIFKLTDGAVDTVGKVSKLTQWMASQGFVATSLDKNTLAEALRNTEIPPQVREALELRQLGSKTSVKKLFAILNMVEEDNRIRGQMLYHAASTGRFAGKGVQLQNLPRPDLPYPEQVIPYIKRGAMEEIELCFGPVQNAISDCIRSLIIAGPQKVFYAADFAAIEARVLAWIAGQDDLLVQFANDEDIYLAFASVIYNKKLDKKNNSRERQVGKAAILGLGFQMGAAKFKLTCEKAGIILSDEEYERVVKLYRSQYKHISRFWYGIEKAAVTAVKNPDKVIKYKCFRLRMRDNNLRIQLPSGRVLNYPDARIIKNPTPWGEVREVVEISAVHPFNKKWVRAVVTPGTFTENVVQAIARDLMVAAMFRVEQSGYPVVLTVHDELVSEVDEGYGDVQEYELLVAATPGWAKGLPVKAEGWTGKRYRK
jgi:DNA polymerase